MIRLSLFVLSFLLSSSCLFSQQPHFSVQALWGPSWYVLNHEDYPDYDYKQDFNYSAGGFFSFNIPIKENTLIFRSGYFYDTKNYTIYYSAPHYMDFSKAERKYAYANVPIFIEYRYNIKEKVYPFLSTGIVFGSLLSAEQTAYLTDGSTVEGFRGYKETNEKGQSCFQASTGVNYRISRVFLFRVEFFVNQRVNNDNYHNADRFGDFSYGIQAGIQYDIFLPFPEPKSPIENH